MGSFIHELQKIHFNSNICCCVEQHKQVGSPKKIYISDMLLPIYFADAKKKKTCLQRTNENCHE